MRLVFLRNNRFVWLIGQLLALSICFFSIHHIFVSNILPDKVARQTFRKVHCFIISKKLATKGHVVPRYRSDFLVTYNVNGIQYNRWLSGNGLDVAFAKDQSDQEDVLSQFDVGGTYLCWYDPADPSSALLVWRHNWLSTLPIIVPAVMSIVLMYYFLKNIYMMITLKRVRRRERKHLH